MHRTGERNRRLIADAFFSTALLPLFLLPRLSETAPARKTIALLFGRLLAPNYSRIIASFGDAYGQAMDEALSAAAGVVTGPIRRIVDCGTGTGFAGLLAGTRFPDARVIGVDIVPHMLRQAAENAARANRRIAFVSADLLRLPFRDGSVDLVVAQNTVPFFREFGRIVRKGGAVIFTDTVASFVVPAARRAARRAGRFGTVVATAAGSGFYVIGRRD